MKKYEIVAGDGLGETVRVVVSRDELRLMIASSMAQGILASEAIENGGVVDERELDYLTRDIFRTMPDSFLTTP